MEILLPWYVVVGGALFVRTCIFAFNVVLPSWLEVNARSESWFIDSMYCIVIPTEVFHCNKRLLLSSIESKEGIYIL